MPLDLSMHALGMFQENTYVLRCSATKTMAVVDPGDGILPILAEHERDGYRLTHILLTHGHIDHAWDLKACMEAYPQALVVVHPDELYNLKNFQAYARMFGFDREAVPEVPARGFVQEGDTVTIGDTELHVVHTPGHTRGHVIFYWGDAGPQVDAATNRLACANPEATGDALVGDLVIMRSVGRTDLPGGDGQQLLHSIREKLFRLPPATRLHSGHGPVSTVAAEIEQNAVVGKEADDSFLGML